MNKYQEALEYFLERDEGENITVTCDWLSNAEELQELVDKATPKKHIAEYCPTCGESVCLLVVELHKDNRTLFYEVSHCCNCGQAIDWSEK